MKEYTTELRPLTVIQEAARKIAPGRAPYFLEAHLVKALLMIEAEGPMGRIKLSKTIGLGEGTVRTLTRHLENKGLIVTSREGITLTTAGKKLTSDLRLHIGKKTKVPPTTLTVGPCNAAILVRNASHLVKAGVEQRDAAIKVGALGATTLIFDHGKLRMPDVQEDASSKDSKIHSLLISELQPRDNDAVIVGSANDESTAEIGAIAAVLETIKTKKD
jgi:predicted transcriptional regulator